MPKNQILLRILGLLEYTHSIFPFGLLLWGDIEFVAIYQIVLLPEVQRPQITESVENYLFFFFFPG